MDFGVAIGYGIPPAPDFWISALDSGDGFRESHIAFSAADRETVLAFFSAAVAAGSEVLTDPTDPRSVMHRQDVFVEASRRIVIARPTGPG